LPVFDLDNGALKRVTGRWQATGSDASGGQPAGGEPAATLVVGSDRRQRGWLGCGWGDPRIHAGSFSRSWGKSVPFFQHAQGLHAATGFPGRGAPTFFSVGRTEPRGWLVRFQPRACAVGRVIISS